MPPKKTLIFLVLLIDVILAKISPQLRKVSKQDEKLLLRTKRQHCTCLNVRVSSDTAPCFGPGLDTLDSTYRCTCNSATNPPQQQRELQQILQQIEPSSRCTCNPGGLTGTPCPPESPLFELQLQQQQWDCFCTGGGQAPRPASPQQFFPWNRPVAANLQQDQAFPFGPKPTTVPPPSPTPYFNQPPPFFDINQPTPIIPLSSDNSYRDFQPYPQARIGNGIVDTYAGPSGNTQKCPCMEVVISVLRTDSNGNRYPLTNPLCFCTPSSNQNIPINVRPAPFPINDPVRQPLVPPQPQFQPSPSISPPISQPIPITPAPLNNYYDVGRQSQYYPQPSYPPSSNLADEPAIMPCVMTITIGGTGGQQCKCQDNYRQCSATHCCNHKTYRSMKSESTTTTNSTPSAVDLLLEFADRFKKHLETQ